MRLEPLEPGQALEQRRLTRDGLVAVARIGCSQLLLASDGPSAIEFAQKHKIDVAVLDIRMAGMRLLGPIFRKPSVN